MPLLTAVGAVADHVCANCGVERHLTIADWRLSDSDDSVISTSPCTCGSTESFSYHEWVYVDRDGNPDHTQVGATQMVLIERVATVLGRPQAKHAGQSSKRYAQTPTEPSPSSVRAYVARLKESI